LVGSAGTLEPFHTLGLGGLGFYRSGKASEMEDGVVVMSMSHSHQSPKDLKPASTTKKHNVKIVVT